MRVFWEQGYEGATLADLTGAMGISRTSMYAAFGNKEELFSRALERYTHGPASYGDRALAMPTARDVAAAFLHGTVEATTRPGHPHGCLGVHGCLAAGDSGMSAKVTLAAWRNDGCERLRERFQQALDDADLPPGADPGLLARYLMTVSNGIAVQAASGVRDDELHQIADTALLNWPPPVDRRRSG